MTPKKQKKIDELTKKYLKIQEYYNKRFRPPTPKLSWGGPIEEVDEYDPSRDPAERYSQKTIRDALDKVAKEIASTKYSRFEDVKNVRVPSVLGSAQIGFVDEFTVGLGDEFLAAVDTLQGSKDPKKIQEAKNKLKEIEEKDASFSEESLGKYRYNWAKKNREMELSEIENPIATGTGRIMGLVSLLMAGGLGAAFLRKVLPKMINVKGVQGTYDTLMRMGKKVEEIPGIKKVLTKRNIQTGSLGGLETFGKSGTPIGDEGLAGEVVLGVGASVGLGVGMRALGKLGKKLNKWADDEGWTPSDAAAWIIGDLSAAERTAIKKLAPYLRKKETSLDIADEVMGKIDNLTLLARHYHKKAVETLSDEPKKILSKKGILKDIQDILKKELNFDPSKTSKKGSLTGVPAGHFPVGQTQSQTLENLLKLQDDLSKFGDYLSEKQMYHVRRMIDADILYKVKNKKPVDKLRIALRRKIDNRLKSSNDIYKKAIRHEADILKFKGTGNPADDHPNNFLKTFDIKIDEETGLVDRIKTRDHLRSQIYQTGTAGVFYKRGTRHRHDKEQKLNVLYRLQNQKMRNVTSPEIYLDWKTIRQTHQPARSKYDSGLEGREGIYDLRPEMRRTGKGTTKTDSAFEEDLVNKEKNPFYDETETFIRNIDPDEEIREKVALPAVRARAAAMNDYFNEPGKMIRGSRNAKIWGATGGSIGSLLGYLFGDTVGMGVAGSTGTGIGVQIGKYIDNQGRLVGKNILTGESKYPSFRMFSQKLGGKVPTETGKFTTSAGGKDIYEGPDFLQDLTGRLPIILPASKGADLSSRPFKLGEFDKMQSREPQSEDRIIRDIESSQLEAIPDMDERKKISRREGEYRDGWRNTPRSFEEREEQRRDAQKGAIEEYLAQQDGKRPPKKFRQKMSGWR